MTYSAVVTAGGTVEGAFAEAIGSRYKALAPVRGVTLIERTLRALQDAGIERIAVVCGAEVAQQCGGDVRVIQQGASGSENQRIALRAWDSIYALLYVTCDMPYITGAAVRRFLQGVHPGEIAMPLTAYDEFVRRFPGAPPFGITLAGERVVNGGLFAIPAGAAMSIERLAVRLFEARKNPLAMAGVVGFSFAARLLFGRLSIGYAERHAARLTGVPARAVRDAAAELAYDIDTLDEYRYADSHD